MLIIPILKPRNWESDVFAISSQQGHDAQISNKVSWRSGLLITVFADVLLQGKLALLLYRKLTHATVQQMEGTILQWVGQPVKFHWPQRIHWRANTGTYCSAEQTHRYWRKIEEDIGSDRQHLHPTRSIGQTLKFHWHKI